MPATGVAGSPRTSRAPGQLATNGTQLAFQTPGDGDYRSVLGNEYSQVNAKQVSLQFLQP